MQQHQTCPNLNANRPFLTLVPLDRYRFPPVGMLATQTYVTITDDIDGGEAVETVEFGLDGASFEIDVSAKNAQKLRTALVKFVDNGRRVPKRGGDSAKHVGSA